jgi:hypoxia up-regulated 1
MCCPSLIRGLKFLSSSKIATNVNADEAAVLGAALYGASLSRQFKTKPLKIVDIGSWDVTIGYPAESGTFPGFSDSQILTSY